MTRAASPRTASPRTASPRVTFGRMEGPADDKEIPINLGGECVGCLTICKEIRFDPAKRLVFTGVRAVLWEIEEEPFFASKDRHGRDSRETVSAAKAWVKSKLGAP